MQFLDCRQLCSCSVTRTCVVTDKRHRSFTTAGDWYRTCFSRTNFTSEYAVLMAFEIELEFQTPSTPRIPTNRTQSTVTFLDQEPISIVSTLIWSLLNLLLLLLLGRPLLKSKAASFQSGSGWNLAEMFLTSKYSFNDVAAVLMWRQNFKMAAMTSSRFA